MHAASDSSFEAECHGMWGAQEILALYVGKITFEEANVARVMALAPAPWTGEKPVRFMCRITITNLLLMFQLAYNLL